MGHLGSSLSQTPRYGRKVGDPAIAPEDRRMSGVADSAHTMLKRYVSIDRLSKYYDFSASNEDSESRGHPEAASNKTSYLIRALHPQRHVVCVKRSGESGLTESARM
jgi:hypothetical protein